MTTHTRSQTQTAISVSMTREMVEQIDQRARALGLNRSQYLAQLCRQDLIERGEITLRETPTNSTAPVTPAQQKTLNIVKYPKLKKAK